MVRTSECFLTGMLALGLGFGATAGDAGKTGVQMNEGCVVRGATNDHRIALVFAGHEFAEDGASILDELVRHKAKASFFFTGDFLARPEFAELIGRIVREGHYLGPHSDKHLLYCPWEGPKRTLITKEEFRADLEANLLKIEGFGVKRTEVRYFLPPYEHSNREIADWSQELGLALVNYTPGTRSNGDYTGEAEQNFVSSQAIFESILAREQRAPDGLNGFLLLLHIGSGPGRADKFSQRFGALLDYLETKGYGLVKLDELLRSREG